MQTTTTHQLPPEHPSAIFPSRLEWLCQPEQIKHTLRLLSYLNSWRKTHQQLLYADRQGLQEVQALVLEQATRTGLVQVATYVNGTQSFPRQLLLESAAENAARGVLIHMKGLNNPDIWPPFYPDGDRIYRHYIRPLYKRITGQDFKLVADAINVLDQTQIQAYMQEQLRKLVERAKVTRQPIPLRRLAALCIAPVDLLPIRENRVCFLDGYETWGDLDRSDLRKLDPEGWSEIAFHYAGPTAEFVFHLPFRRAASFVSVECLYVLQSKPGISQPQAIFQNRQIDEAEGMKWPAREILQDLGVDIARVCPHKLLEKKVYLALPAVRDLLWPTNGDESREDPWDGICLPHELI
jgi:hypothetical protein